MQTGSHRAVIPAAYVRPINFHSPPLLCTDLMQETIWPTVKTAMEPQALLTLMAVSPPPAAPTLPATPMLGPIQPIGRGKMTQRQIIDPTTATRGIRLTPAPSATISLKVDQHLIRPRPAASQPTLQMQTGPLMDVTLEVRTIDDDRSLKCLLCRFPSSADSSFLTIRYADMLPQYVVLNPSSL